MPQSASIQNNFIGGLKTEFTGLNFPENSCTDTENCVFSLIGDVLRREGINFEANSILNNIGVGSKAVNTYKWTNVGGDGDTQVLVLQVGDTLYFFETSAAVVTSPISAQLLASTITITNFQALNNIADPSITECQFSDGNGYLFVYHPDLDPFACTFNNGTITASDITIQIRDFTGISDGLQGSNVNNRPGILSQEHLYNLQNQGWTQGAPWSASSNTTSYTGQNINTANLGSYQFAIASGTVGISSGQVITLESGAPGGFRFNNDPSSPPYGVPAGQGTITNYTGSTLTVNIFETLNGGGGWSGFNEFPIWVFVPISTGYITEWTAAEGVYPSNADVWWVFKDETGAFNPTTTANNITLDSGQAPQGHFILNAFTQQRTATSGTSGLTDVITTVRPRTGCWFQGRVWYAGVDASQPATGDAQYYTWTENIYFSTVVSTPEDFGSCYQTNDPTSETLFEELPTDGGVIVIQGSGSIYKLFPVQNGVLVFAANGVWFIRGNSGLGFTANDYSVNKISSVQSISGTSFVDILGYPMFWNEEGIYSVQPSKEQAPYGYGGLAVEPLTVGTILTYYNNIPRDSKLYARGAYNPISYIVEWCFRSTEEAGIANRYQFDTILNLRVVGPRGPEEAFYPYTISNNNACYISGINYISYPTGTLDPVFKYLTIVNTNDITFSEENDSTTWFDWFAYDNIGVDYLSYFITGYSLHGKALRKWSSNYINVFLRNDTPSAYIIQSQWDYATTGNTGKWSTQQLITNFNPNFGMLVRRHKLRGHGMAMQIKVTSVQGQPFDIMGWSMFETIGEGA